MRLSLRQTTAHEWMLFSAWTINVNWSGMPTCEPTSSATPPSDKLRSTQEIAASPKRIDPLFKTWRLGDRRASSIVDPSRAIEPQLRLSAVTNAEGQRLVADLFTI